MVEIFEYGEYLATGGSVGLKDGVRLTALLGAICAAKGDVDMRIGKQVGEGGEHAWQVAMGYEQGTVHAGDVDAHAVDATDAHLASAEAFASYLHGLAAGVFHIDIDGVGMDGAVVAGNVESVAEPTSVCNVEGVADALIIGIEAQDAGHEGAVCTVASVGVGKAIPQSEGHVGDVSVDK